MTTPRRRSRKKEPDYIVHKDKDLRIPDASPFEVAQKVMRAGVNPLKNKSKPGK